MNVVVFSTRVAAVGLPTALLEEWVLDRLEGPLQCALIVERATKRSAPSRGHESRNGQREIERSVQVGIRYLNLTGETIRLIDSDGHGQILPPAFDEPLRPPRIMCEALPYQSAHMAVTGCDQSAEAIQEKVDGLRLRLASASCLIVEPETLEWLGPHLISPWVRRVLTPETHPSFVERDADGKIIGYRALRCYTEAARRYPWD